MSTEEWRPVVGHEGYYEVSSLGRVRSLRLRNRRVDLLRDEPLIRSPERVHNGYLRVQIEKSGGE